MWRVFVAMYGLLLLLSMGSRAWARFLRRSGLAGLQHVESSRSRDRTHVPCVGKQTLNHCATREVLSDWFLWIWPLYVQDCAGIGFIPFGLASRSGIAGTYVDAGFPLWEAAEQVSTHWIHFQLPHVLPRTHQILFYSTSWIWNGISL